VGRDDARAPLSPDEVGELAAHPLVEIGAHTVEHPILSRAPLEVQAAEVTGSCATIQRWTGKPVRAFAYPNGRPGVDQTDDTRRIVASAGVDLAFSTQPGFATPDADPLMLPRFTITAGVSVAHLLNRLHHAWA
jgi:peptidoglycan/xylan/chitin deacetylase (PgdA/CDA1 family)